MPPRSTLKALRRTVAALTRDVDDASVDFQDRADMSDEWGGGFYGFTTAERYAPKGRRTSVICIYGVAPGGAWAEWSELLDVIEFTL